MEVSLVFLFTSLLSAIIIVLIQIRQELNKNDKKTKVVCMDDSQYGDFKKGDKGYVDGYVTGGGSPCVVVAIGKKLVLVEPYRLEVI